MKKVDLLDYEVDYQGGLSGKCGLIGLRSGLSRRIKWKRWTYWTMKWIIKED